MKINVSCNLKAFRKFLILNVCQSFIPNEWKVNDEIFPEKIGKEGSIIIEAKYKETVGVIKGMKFSKVKEILKIVYNSKSGRTKLTWVKVKGNEGKLIGDASVNSVVNLALAGIIKSVEA
ncbi:hypothetical protein KEJ50_01030 [Candidatus Bathyarchaeota archaeon]|nr:hypothetical protein [Candidatus Bathyarchaeota archaeon]